MLRHRGVPAPRDTTAAGDEATTSRRRALVTGASGFIGRHLVRQLVADGWDVAITTRPASRVPADVAASCSTVDVESSFEEFAWNIGLFRPEVCFHLATYFSNGHDGADIDMLVDANVTFGTRVLEALSRCGGVTLVNAGSRMQHYLAEEYRPVSLYAATKQAFADVLRYYADVHRLPAVTVEFPDTFGPDDPRKKLLTLLQQAALSGEQLLMSPGDQLIEAVHVADAVTALLTAEASAKTTAPTYSVTGEVLPLRHFVREVEQSLGRRVPVTWGARPYRDREMMSRWGHWPQLPGWQRSMGLREALDSVLSTSTVASPDGRVPVAR